MTLGVVGQSEAVVRTEEQDGLAVKDDVGTLRPADQANSVVKAQRAELAQASLDLDHVGTVG